MSPPGWTTGRYCASDGAGWATSPIPASCGCSMRTALCSRATQTRCPGGAHPRHWPHYGGTPHRRGVAGAMRAKYGDDKGTSAAARHRSALRAGSAACAPRWTSSVRNVVIVWGDDQYENYREEVIPPFSVLAYDDFTVKPWLHAGDRPNIWGEGPDTEFVMKGHRQAGKYLTSRLLDQGIRHRLRLRAAPRRLGTCLHQHGPVPRFDRRGFDYPVLPFHVNCYGRKIIVHRGTMSRLADARPVEEMDPPLAVAPAVLRGGGRLPGPWPPQPLCGAHRVVTSWSHAFLNDKTWRVSRHRVGPPLLPGAAGRRLRPVAGCSPAAIGGVRTAGDAQLVLPVGAMNELGRVPAETDFVETYVLSFNKCFALFSPERLWSP